MNIILHLKQINSDYIFYGDPVKNSIIENAVFTRIIYSNQLMSLNGLYISFKPNETDNKINQKELIELLIELEKIILFKIDINKKNCQYKIRDYLKVLNSKYGDDFKINNYILTIPDALHDLLNDDSEEYDRDDNDYKDYNYNDDAVDNDDTVYTDDNASDNVIDNDASDINKQSTNSSDIEIQYNKLPTNVNDLNDDTLSKLYQTFNIKYNSLSVDTLQESYNNLKTKVMDMDNGSDKTLLLNYINKSYQLLRKYMINELYGNEFTTTNTNESKTLDNDELSLNQNRYNLLSNPNVIENNQSQIIQKNTQGSQDVYINETPADVLNLIRRT